MVYSKLALLVFARNLICALRPLNRLSFETGKRPMERQLPRLYRKAECPQEVDNPTETGGVLLLDLELRIVGWLGEQRGGAWAGMLVTGRREANLVAPPAARYQLETPARHLDHGR